MEPTAEIGKGESPTTTPRWWFWTGPLLFLCHLATTIATGHAGWLYWVVDGGFLAGSLASQPTRRLTFLALPLWLTFVAYKDVLPWALLYRIEVHVGDLFDAELRWFGVNVPDGRIILPAVFRETHWPIVDLVCGIVYMSFQVQMAPYAIYLFLRDQRRLSLLMWTFLVVHLMGFATYVLYPAAPPWYVLDYGQGPAILETASNPAGVARLDTLLGLGVAQTIYAQASNVFGAMPSLHMALATVFVLVSLRMGWRWFVPSTAIALIMMFGAVYFCHHYVLDLIVGIAYSVIGFSLVTAIQNWQRAKSDAQPT